MLRITPSHRSKNYPTTCKQSDTFDTFDTSVSSPSLAIMHHLTHSIQISHMPSPAHQCPNHSDIPSSGHKCPKPQGFGLTPGNQTRQSVPSEGKRRYTYEQQSALAANLPRSDAAQILPVHETQERGKRVFDDRQQMGQQVNVNSFSW